MRRLFKKYHKHQTEIFKVVRFLIAGAWNTLFGVGVYALLYELFHPWVNYLVLVVPSNILAITNAYICYKLFVFKTRGNVMREYLRFYVVYGGTMVLGFIMMFGLVSGLGIPPVLAQCICVGVTVICSYFSHRGYSFRKREDEAE